MVTASEESEWPERCVKAKESYEECFFRWYRESFLKGVTDNPCKELWEAYETCVKQFLSSRQLQHVLSPDWNVKDDEAENQKKEPDEQKI
eukprot:jgi/Galph1/5988/GphlegSOOS_G4630.1